MTINPATQMYKCIKGRCNTAKYYLTWMNFKSPVNFVIQDHQEKMVA